MATPLVMLGSGGNYVTRWEPSGTSILRRVGRAEAQGDEPDMDSATSNAGGGGSGQQGGRRRGQMVITHTSARPVEDTWEPTSAQEPEPSRGLSHRQWVRAGTLNAAAGAISVWMTQQQRALAAATLDLRTFGKPPDEAVVEAGPAEIVIAASPGPAVSAATPSRSEIADEPDPQTTEDSDPYPRLAPDARLFPDDAGAGRRVERQQGHRVRARRVLRS